MLWGAALESAGREFDDEARPEPPVEAEEQRAKEVPNGRRPISDFAFAGAFKAREA